MEAVLDTIKTKTPVSKRGVVQQLVELINDMKFDINVVTECDMVLAIAAETGRQGFRSGQFILATLYEDSATMECEEWRQIQILAFKYACKYGRATMVAKMLEAGDIHFPSTGMSLVSLAGILNQEALSRYWFKSEEIKAAVRESAACKGFVEAALSMKLADAPVDWYSLNIMVKKSFEATESPDYKVLTTLLVEAEEVQMFHVIATGLRSKTNDLTAAGILLMMTSQFGALLLRRLICVT